jgi:hypothetical protein
MAIQSASEFEAVVNKLQMRVQRVLSERGSVPVIEGALRDLQQLFEAARQPAKLKALRGQVDKLTDLLIKEIPDDNAMCEQLWDLADFVDYRA